MFWNSQFCKFNCLFIISYIVYILLKFNITFHHGQYYFSFIVYKYVFHWVDAYRSGTMILWYYTILCPMFNNNRHENMVRINMVDLILGRFGNPLTHMNLDRTGDNCCGFDSAEGSTCSWKESMVGWDCVRDCVWRGN